MDSGAEILNIVSTLWITVFTATHRVSLAWHRLVFLALDTAGVIKFMEQIG